MEIKGAIFDMDGTLVDSLGFWDYFWKELSVYCNDPNFKMTPEHDKKIRTTTMRECMGLTKSTFNLKQSEEELYEFLKKKIKQYYLEVAQLKRGAVELLEYLKSKKVKMCLASATDLELVKLALKRFEIDKYFTAVCSCSEIKKGKDKPDIYYLAVKLLETTIEDSCVFEDSLVAIKTAKNAGFKTVGIYDINNYGQEEIKSLVDLYVREGESLTKFYK